MNCVFKNRTSELLFCKCQLQQLHLLEEKKKIKHPIGGGHRFYFRLKYRNMINCVSNDAAERLDQLNEELTRLMHSVDFFNPDKWSNIRINLAKWREQEFVVSFKHKASNEDFTQEEKLILYKSLSDISEILLLESYQEKKAINHSYESAAFFRDLQIERRQALSMDKLIRKSIPLFTIEDKTLVLKYVDHFIIELMILENVQKL
jgi:hypothetical protein